MLFSPGTLDDFHELLVSGSRPPVHGGFWTNSMHFLREGVLGSCFSYAAWFNSGYTLTRRSTESLAACEVGGHFSAFGGIFGLRPSRRRGPGGGDAGSLTPRCSATVIRCSLARGRTDSHVLKTRTTTTTTTTTPTTTATTITTTTTTTTITQSAEAPF